MMITININTYIIPLILIILGIVILIIQNGIMIYKIGFYEKILDIHKSIFSQTVNDEIKRLKKL